MGFFDEVIDPAWIVPRENYSPDPPWLGPPHDVIPARVETELELVRTLDLVVWISGSAVFPGGVGLELHVRWNRPRRVQLPVVPGDLGRRGLCLGVHFDDGRRVLAIPRRRQPTQAQQTQLVVVAPLRARPCFATTEIWLWPLPTVALSWVVEWRDQRIGESRVRFDVAPLGDVACDARPVWPARHGASG